MKMLNGAGVCIICLRTDRKLKVLDNRLTEFHHKLSECIMRCLHPEYCTECEHLLKKMYHFKLKCRKATEILINWKEQETPKEYLYKLQVPTSLGIWDATKSIIYHYTVVDPPAPTNETCQIPLGNIKTELSPTTQPDQSMSSPVSPIPFPTEEVLLETIFESNVKQEFCDELTINEEDFKIEDMILEEKSTQNLLNNAVTENQNAPIQGSLITNMTNEVVEGPLSSRVTDGSLQGSFIPTMLVEPLRVSVIPKMANEPIKLSPIPEMSNTLLQGSVISNMANPPIQGSIISKMTNDPIQRSLISKLANAPLQGSLITETADALVQGTLASRMATALIQGSLISKMTKKPVRVSLVSKQTNAQNQGSHISEITTPTLMKPGAANTPFSNEDTARDEKVNEYLKMLRKPKEYKRKRIPKKKIESNVLDNQNCNKMNEDDKPERCKARNKANSPCQHCLLKQDLIVKFGECGELKSKDVVIDKELILTIIDNKRDDERMQELWTNLYRRKTFTPRAISLLRILQNRHTSKYDSVFEIESLNTEEQVMEKFEMRKTYERYIDAKFKCDMCHRGFDYKKILEHHMKMHDEKSGKFECRICKFRSRTQGKLNTHVRTHSIIYKCKLCPLVTNYKDSMVNHYNQHQGVRYTCETCNITYKSKSAYSTHLTYSCKNRQHVCTHCASTFMRDAGLKLHMMHKHRNEPPIDPKKSGMCSVCKLRFPTQEVFRRHLRISHQLDTKKGVRKQAQSFSPEQPQASSSQNAVETQADFIANVDSMPPT